MAALVSVMTAGERKSIGGHFVEFHGLRAELPAAVKHRSHDNKRNDISNDGQNTPGHTLFPFGMLVNHASDQVHRNMTMFLKRPRGPQERSPNENGAGKIQRPVSGRGEHFSKNGFHHSKRGAAQHDNAANVSSDFVDGYHKLWIAHFILTPFCLFVTHWTINIFNH